MSLFRLVYKSLRQHLFSSLVTALSIALAGGLLMSVWTLRAQARKTFTSVNAGFDAVLGARGSKLQLALNAFFHLEESPGNLPISDWREIQKRPDIQRAVPIAVGDNFKGWRVVGTIPEMFQDGFIIHRGGRMFDATAREAIVGSFAAKRLGLRPGDTFHPYHGLNFSDQAEAHQEDYVVVGILEPSNTPADRVLWIPLEGLQKMSGHNAGSAEEISAVLIKFKGGSASTGFLLDQEINKKGSRQTLAWPIGRVMAQLFDKVGWFDQILSLVAALVAVVAAASIMASIYNSMNERRREIAILRALGAGRRIISTTIILEAATIAAVGMLIGFLFYFAILAVSAAILRAQVGVVINVWAFHPILLFAPFAMVALGALAGVVPAIKAYRTDVAENLVPIS
jgi:putative ABC transport system permease protein